MSANFVRTQNIWPTFKSLLRVSVLLHQPSTHVDRVEMFVVSLGRVFRCRFARQRPINNQQFLAVNEQMNHCCKFFSNKMYSNDLFMTTVMASFSWLTCEMLSPLAGKSWELLPALPTALSPASPLTRSKSDTTFWILSVNGGDAPVQTAAVSPWEYIREGIPPACVCLPQRRFVCTCLFDAQLN